MWLSSHSGSLRWLTTKVYIEDCALLGYIGIKLRLTLFPYCTVLLYPPCLVYKSHGANLLQLSACTRIDMVDEISARGAHEKGNGGVVLQQL